MPLATANDRFVCLSRTRRRRGVRRHPLKGFGTRGLLPLARRHFGDFRAGRALLRLLVGRWRTHRLLSAFSAESVFVHQMVSQSLRFVEDRSTTKRMRTVAGPGASFKMLFNVIPQLVISNPRHKPLGCRNCLISHTKRTVAWTHQGVAVGNRSTPLGHRSGQMRLTMGIPIFTYHPTETMIAVVDILLEVAKTTGYLPSNTGLNVLTAGGLWQTVSG